MPDMARKQEMSKRAEEALTPKEREVLGYLRKGYTGTQIARKIAGSDSRKYRGIRRRIQRTIAKSPEFRSEAEQAQQGMIYEHLHAMTQAQIKRAMRGRTDAFKLLMEMSGVHSPKTEQHHSGEIDLRVVQVPRPDPVDNTPNARPQIDEPIVDAEVVEDS